VIEHRLVRVCYDRRQLHQIAKQDNLHPAEGEIAAPRFAKPLIHSIKQIRSKHGHFVDNHTLSALKDFPLNVGQWIQPFPPHERLTSTEQLVDGHARCSLSSQASGSSYQGIDCRLA